MASAQYERSPKSEEVENDARHNAYHFMTEHTHSQRESLKINGNSLDGIHDFLYDLGQDGAGIRQVVALGGRGRDGR